MLTEKQGYMDSSSRYSLMLERARERGSVGPSDMSSDMKRLYSM